MSKTVKSSDLPSVTVDKLPTGEGYHAVHTYYNNCPWNKNMDIFLFSRFKQHNDIAEVCFLDLAKGEVTPFATTSQYCGHDGASQKWINDDRAVIFCASDKEGRAVAGVYDLETCKTTLYDQFPGYTYFSSSSDGRHITLSEVPLFPGLVSSPDETFYGKVIIYDRIDDKVVKKLCSEETLEALPEEQRKKIMETSTVFWLKSPDFNPDLTTVRMGLRGFARVEGYPDGKMIYYPVNLHFNMKSGQITYNLKAARYGHAVWVDNHRMLELSDKPGGGGRQLMIRDTRNDTREVFIETTLSGAGHPSVSPDGVYLVTDTYTFGEDHTCLETPIYLANMGTRTLSEIACPKHTWHHTTKLDDGHPHPAWAPNSRQVAYNSNESGQLGVYRMTLQIS